MTDSSADQPLLKGALHTHTTCSDGDLTPAELLAVYRDLGFDFVALTDHDFLARPGAYEGLPDEFDGMLVYKGIERSVFARGYVHVNQIPADADWREVLNILNHPAQHFLSVEEVVECISELESSMPIHAVDVTLKGFYTPEYDVEAIPYPKVATDDSHTREGCGRAWVEVACPKDHGAIIQAIKNGLARVCYNQTARRSDWNGYGGLHDG